MKIKQVSFEFTEAAAVEDSMDEVMKNMEELRESLCNFQTALSRMGVKIGQPMDEAAGESSP